MEARKRSKGEKTRAFIKETARKLFASRGFKEVTMKDICEACGLSRGGLYRYFGSTREIFEEMFRELAAGNEKNFFSRMENGESARQILEDILEQGCLEMEDSKASLSLAIYEYSQVSRSDFWEKQVQVSHQKWIRFLEYGISRGEFNKVSPEQITDLYLYAYQGVRMWSVIFPMKPEVSRHITDSIREILLPRELGNSPAEEMDAVKETGPAGRAK